MMKRNEIMQIALACAVENGIELKHIEVQQYKDSNDWLVRLDYHTPQGGIQKRFSERYQAEHLKIELGHSIKQHLMSKPPAG